MIYHMLLLKEPDGLTAEARRELIRAFQHAIREIPTVRQVHLTRRIRVDTEYEGLMPEIADYAIMIEFDNVTGLKTYLNHPAHEDLGRRFAESVQAPLILDFETVGFETLREVPAGRTF